MNDYLKGVAGFPERLDLIIGRESVSSFARRTGIKEGSIRSYRSGTQPQLDKIAAIAAATGVSLDWLVLGQGEPVTSRTLQDTRSQHLASAITEYMTGPKPTMEFRPEGDGEFRLVPRYDIRASAGAGQLVGVENIDAEMAFRSEWLRRAAPGAQNLALIEAEGDSMEPTLRNGDTLLINLEISRVEANGIYLIQLDGMLLVKRLQPLMRGGLLIRSDNENYRDETIDTDEIDNIHIVGRVIWYGRQL